MARRKPKRKASSGRRPPGHAAPSRQAHGSQESGLATVAVVGQVDERYEPVSETTIPCAAAPVAEAATVTPSAPAAESLTRHTLAVEAVAPCAPPVEIVAPPAVATTPAPVASVGPTPRRKPLAWLKTAGFVVLLGVALFWAYRPAWQGGFLWDDDYHVPRSELRSIDGLRRIWFEPGTIRQYYPVAHTVFWLEQRVFGEATLGYHLVNLSLHLASAVLVLLIFRSLGWPGGCLAAAVFALHPVHVESVAWISELKNVLSGLFYLAALAACLRFDRNRSHVAYAAGLMLFVVAMLAKAVTATLPAAVLLVLWCKRGRLEARRDVLPLAPHFVLALAIGSLSVWMERKMVGAEGADFALSAVERVLLAGRAAWFYFGKLVWPAELTFIYPRWELRAGDWRAFAYLAATVAAVVLFWAARRRTRAPLTAALFLGGTLLPALGFFNVFPFRYSFVADHFQYLASLGVIGLFAAAVGALLGTGGWRRTAGLGLSGMVLVALASATWQHCHDFADLETLYRTTLARNPNCWMARENLGNLLGVSGRTSESIEQLRESLRLNPDAPTARLSLGAALVDAGKTADGIEQYRLILRDRPDSVEARKNLAAALLVTGQAAESIEQWESLVGSHPELAEAHCGLANAMVTTHRFDAAITHCREAVRLKPELADAYNHWGNALFHLGRLREASEMYQQALQRKPDSAEFHYNLATVLGGTGDRAAAQHYRDALRLNPKLAEAHNNLAAILLQEGQRDAAIEHFAEAVKLKADYLAAQANMATALHQAGRYREAIASYEAAIAMARASGNTALADQLLSALRAALLGRQN